MDERILTLQWDTGFIGGCWRMAVVTIAHETGTAGPEIGLLLASRLRYRYVMRRLIAARARRQSQRDPFIPRRRGDG